MLFNSIEYFYFLPTIFIVYWFLNGNLKRQNFFLLVTSYFFYGLWDYRFLSLIAISSMIDFTLGRAIHHRKSQREKNFLLAISVIVNIGLLFTFKYFNFFIESFVDFLHILGFSSNLRIINLILPVGISFYTFQTLSYTLDIYNGNLKPTKSILNFFTFVAFFPQLVAGPIERASNFLPQIESKRTFQYEQGKEGLRQILWGLFKKIVIADNCAIYVNTIFENYAELNGLILIVGAILFVIQIYGDFSGYSDIAIGTANLLGITLMQNFNTPYFSTNTTDFWRRWHISLSTWFRDYLFVPITMKFRNNKLHLYFATFITFVLLGLWHGANWTFVAFGLLQAIALSIEIATLRRRRRIRKAKKFLIAYYLISWLLTMTFWTSVLVIFRSDTLQDSFLYFKNILFQPDENVITIMHSLFLSVRTLGIILLFAFLMFFIEWLQKDGKYALDKIENKFSVLYRWGLYFLLITAMIKFYTPAQEFIYFQF